VTVEDEVVSRDPFAGRPARHAVNRENS